MQAGWSNIELHNEKVSRKIDCNIHFVCTFEHVGRVDPWFDFVNLRETARCSSVRTSNFIPDFRFASRSRYPGGIRATENESRTGIRFRQRRGRETTTSFFCYTPSLQFRPLSPRVRHVPILLSWIRARYTE